MNPFPLRLKPKPPYLLVYSVKCQMILLLKGEPPDEKESSAHATCPSLFLNPFPPRPV